MNEKWNRTYKSTQKKSRHNDILRRECKNKLGGEFTTLQYLYALTSTIEAMAIETGDASPLESNGENSDVTLDQGPLYCFCLQVRLICRAITEDCIQIFT